MQAGRDVVDAIGGQQPPRVLGKQPDLVGPRDRERVDPVVGHPADVGVDGFGRQLDRLGVERSQGARHLHRATSGLSCDVGVQLGVRGEAPRAVDDHPHRQSHLAVDDGGLQLTVAQLHDFVGDAVNAQVGVARAGRDRGRQRRIGKRGVAAARGSRHRLVGALSRLTP